MQVELTDEEYYAFLKWLREVTIEEMSKAKGKPEQQKEALCRYWKRGDKYGLSGGEMIDYLAVDYGSILDYAGYEEEEAMAVMGISDALTDEEVMSVALPEEIEVAEMKNKKNAVSFSLSHDEAIVLFEMLARWACSNHIMDLESAEKSVLQKISAKLENQLVEPFLSEYDAITAKAKQRITGQEQSGYRGSRKADRREGA